MVIIIVIYKKVRSWAWFPYAGKG